jgi:hypothetical protein
MRFHLMYMSNIPRVLFVHFRSKCWRWLILLFPVSESAADGVIQHSEGSKRWGRNPIIGNPWENNKKKIPPFFFDMITVANKRFAVRTFFVS